jgi:hypothetical protein
MTFWILVPFAVIVLASALWGLWGLIERELARRAVEEDRQEGDTH